MRAFDAFHRKGAAGASGGPHDDVQDIGWLNPVNQGWGDRHAARNGATVSGSVTSVSQPHPGGKTGQEDHSARHAEDSQGVLSHISYPLEVEMGGRCPIDYKGDYTGLRRERGGHPVCGVNTLVTIRHCSKKSEGSMSHNPGFQLSLHVQGRLCLVLGGDEGAAEKVQRLLEAGARVIVIHPTLHESLRELTASGKILHRGRYFLPPDIEGAVLILNTLRGDRAFLTTLLELTKKEKILLWSIDQPDYSTVMMPALTSSGLLRIAVSTSGAAPALASQLRQDLDHVFDGKFSQFLDWLGTLREDSKRSEPDAARRRDLLREAVQGFKFRGEVEYPPRWSPEQQETREEAVPQEPPEKVVTRSESNH